MHDGDLKLARLGLYNRVLTVCIRNMQALGPRALLVLSTVILPTALQPGHDLCQQGAPADRLWFLTEGALDNSHPCLECVLSLNMRSCCVL
jgi:hypothetical protein